MRSRSKQRQGSAVISEAWCYAQSKITGGYSAHDWRNDSTTYYNNGSPTLDFAERSEIVDAEPHDRSRIKPVSHKRARASAVLKNEYYIPESSIHSTSWDQFQPDTGKTVRVTAEYRTVWEIKNRWSGVSSNSVVPGLGHILNPAGVNRAVRSIVSDVSELYSKGDNLGLALGELLECKTLLTSLGDIYRRISKITLKDFTNACSTGWLTWIWGLKPTVDMSISMLDINDRFYARVAELSKRKACKKQKYQRRWAETDTIVMNGQTVPRQTINCVTCEGNFDYNFDLDSLLRAMVLRVTGATQVFETCWQLVPLSFALDGLARSYGWGGIRGLTHELSKELESEVNKFTGIKTPTEQQVLASSWCYSQKSTCLLVKENNYLTGIPSEYQPKAELTWVQYDRSPLPMNEVPSDLGMSPSFGLAVSLGTVVITKRT